MAEKEYIERGAVLRHIFDQIEEFGDPDPIDSPVARGSLMGLEYAHSVVSVLPASDVVEVTHGEWIYDENGMDWGLGAWECSLCRCKNDNLPPDSNIKPLRWAGSKYCPNCGAKMDGGKNETD